AGNYHALDRTIGLNCIYGLTQFVQGKTVELVDGFTLEVEIQFDDTTLKSFNRDGFTFVNHQLISTIWKLNSTHQSQPASCSAAEPSRVALKKPGTPTDAIFEQ